MFEILKKKKKRKTEKNKKAIKLGQFERRQQDDIRMYTGQNSLQPKGGGGRVEIKRS